ncbi:DUF3231 family protein [Bacillus sp. J37]|uniref:DUF3231 family protein n=1 Tax=Bacillus sp. J37 TaxID=935837 RepID=UPI00047BEB39|nr:DUF3231 family protein [Bacillus sp. J37]
MDQKELSPHHIELTSSEIGALWASYMSESASKPVLLYFNQIVEDSEIKGLLDFALAKCEEHIATLSEIFHKENYPLPIGFSEGDVKVNAPRLFSDPYILYFIRNLGKAAIAADGMALTMSARKDLRELYTHYLTEAAKVQEMAKEIELSKGLYIRTPNLAIPNEATMVDHQGFLRGWFGERRTLSATEIAHISMNHTNNALGKTLLMGFVQTTKTEELRNHFIRGIDIAASIMETLRRLLEECSLPSPRTWDTEVTDSTVAPFSDKLMLFHINSLNAIGLGNIGGSLALSMRRDLSAKYLKMMKDIGTYAEDSANIMIKNSWFERPPQAMNRDYLSKKH